MYPYSPLVWVDDSKSMRFCESCVLNNHELDRFFFGFLGGILLDSLQNSNRFSSALQNGTRWVGNQTVNQVRQPWAKFGMKPNVNGALARKKPVEDLGNVFCVFFPVGWIGRLGPGDFLGRFSCGVMTVMIRSQMLRILLDNIGSKMASVSVSVWER